MTVYYENRSSVDLAVTTAPGVAVATVGAGSSGSFVLAVPTVCFVEDVATHEIRSVAFSDGSAVAYSPSFVLSVSPQAVHVENPVQGMEFVILALGFLCGAVTWRFIYGRW